MSESIEITDLSKRDFIAGILQYATANPFEISMKDNQFSIANPTIRDMVTRYLENRTAVFPHHDFDAKTIYWIVTNKETSELIRSVEEIQHFIAPAYVEKYKLGLFHWRSSEFHYLNADAEHLYCFRSPVKFKSIILAKLSQWSRIESMRATITIDKIEPTAYILRKNFQQALILKEWEEASSALNQLREGHYLSADNCEFLRIQLLSAQSKWDTIWNDPHYPIIAAIDPLPSGVRKALLTAFYKSIIANLELREDVNGILASMREFTYKLGTLLRFRLGLSNDIFIRIFAYDAVLRNAPEKFSTLSEATTDEFTLTILKKLKTYIEPSKAEVHEKSCIEEAQDYFKENLYDESYLCVVNCEPSIQKTQLLLGIGALTEQEEIRQLASGCFYQHTEQEREVVLTDLHARLWAKDVLGYHYTDETKKGFIVSPVSWFEYWTAIKKNQHIEQITKLLKDSDYQRRLNKEDRNDLSELSLILLDILTDSQLTREQHKAIIESLEIFIPYILDDPNYPRTHFAELYEYTLSLLQRFGNKNKTNLSFLGKFVEGLLYINCELSDKLWGSTASFLPSSPSSIFITEILDLMELFYEYGFHPNTLAALWEQWIGTLLNHFKQEGRAQVMYWIAIGERLGVNTDLIESLKRIDAEISQQVESPISLLDKKSITIFSLRPKSARRAADYIMSINPKIRVEVCSDTVLTETAKQLTKKSDIVILATDCLTHALTYGVEPFLKHPPVYPRSSGERGIIDALNNYVLGEKIVATQ